MADYKVYRTDYLPKPKELPNGTLYGNFSVTLPNKIKLVPYQHLRVVGDEWDTETSFTRRFMATLPKRKARMQTFQGYLKSSPPLLVKPGYCEDAVYIDISAAYPSIYALSGWGVEYERGNFYDQDQPLLYPYPMTWKAGRSFVVTGARHIGRSLIVNNGSVFERRFQNPYSNPSMVAFVWDTLSMIARFAEYATGALYWNMDGGIVPTKGHEILTGFIEQCGLQWKEKARGRATVVNASAWQVGKKHTARWLSESGNVFAGDRIKIGVTDAEWLFKKIRK